MKLLLTMIVSAAVLASAEEPAGRALLIKVAPLFSEPVTGSLPVSFAQKGDTCQVDSVFTDSAGTSWFRLRLGSKSQWTNCSVFSYITGPGDDVKSRVLKDDADVKRRLRILLEHPEWPRRIKGAVRGGNVCLGMSSEQLEAAWGTPFQEGASFVLGIGTCETRFFHAAKEDVLFVLLNRGAVTGWYEQNR